jgi:hypothetical protein
MALDQSAFLIAGTAIAIAGVGLYIWDTRGKDAVSGYSAPSTQYNSQYNSTAENGYFGGRRYSRKHKKGQGRKTKRH